MFRWCSVGLTFTAARSFGLKLKVGKEVRLCSEDKLVSRRCWQITDTLSECEIRRGSYIQKPSFVINMQQQIPKKDLVIIKKNYWNLINLTTAPCTMFISRRIFRNSFVRPSLWWLMGVGWDIAKMGSSTNSNKNNKQEVDSGSTVIKGRQERISLDSSTFHFIQFYTWYNLFYLLWLSTFLSSIPILQTLSKQVMLEQI